MQTAIALCRCDRASPFGPFKMGFSSDCGDNCHRASNGLYIRRKLRTAVRDGNIAELQHLLQACRVDGNSGGIAVDDIINGSVSDVFSYSALTLAVRCSHLDVVEAIISTPRCDVDRPGRTGLSALDEALDAWFRAAVASVPGNTSPTQSPSSFSQTAITSCESGNAGLLVVSTDVSSSICSWNRHNCAQRYRIVRRLLEVGASRMSLVALDRLVAAALDTASGQAFVEKLVKVVCAKGVLRIRSVLLGVLVWYPSTVAMLNLLLRSSASPMLIAHSVLHQPVSPTTIQRSIPLRAAVILVRSCNDPQLLNFIDYSTSVLISSSSASSTATGADAWNRVAVDGLRTLWPEYRELIVLLTLSGHRFRINVLDWLYRYHAAVYRWVVERGGSGSAPQRRPASLLHVARVAVRRQVAPNVVAALPKLVGTLPTPLREFLLFNEVPSA